MALQLAQWCSLEALDAPWRPGAGPSCEGVIRQIDPPIAKTKYCDMKKNPVT
jgi:hypothetical protein